ncbi:MAG: VanW family protein, partial [Candidatus Riflebacteria bacterium]|nr:VanW family protein [Candidatus Riflebacteria bacterium]
GSEPVVSGQPEASGNDLKTEIKSVQIAFSDGQKQIEVKEVPLLSVTTKNDEVVKIEADGDMVKSLIDNLELPDLKQPEPARIENSKNQFSRIIRGEPGLGIDKQKTLAALEDSIKKINDQASISVNVVISADEGKEGFSSKMREMGFTKLIATFSTLHSGHIDDQERNVNLEIASHKIDGLIIPPGGKFSFNKVVGARSEKNGFKKAGVISQGRVIPGLGGGICQVSTTLYRAALLSGMKIDERHNHSIYDGIDYADRGLDAAVAWGYKDFRFTNSLDIPVLIVSRAGKGKVEIEIYGEKVPFESIVLETRNEVKHAYNTQKKNNASLKKGEIKVVHPGVHGYSVEAWRKITASGSTREERLSKDRYLTFNRIEEINN